MWLEGQFYVFHHNTGTDQAALGRFSITHRSAGQGRKMYNRQNHVTNRGLAAASRVAENLYATATGIFLGQNWL